jgi:LmbE family N-acetylglucosaminyl deacetylase
MLNFDLGKPAGSAYQVLCLGAHSDDIDVGCGGTILALLERFGNVAFRWIVFSANEERAREANDSAAAFLTGAQDSQVVVKNYRDGFFPFNGSEIKDDFEALKSELNPDIVFTHYREDRHQDHRLISELTWNTFRNHLILEYEVPKYDGDLGQPNVFVPLPESLCAKKTGILLNSFHSQRRRPWFDEQTFMAMLRLRGMEANSPTRFAEAFYCRKAVLGQDSR